MNNIVTSFMTRQVAEGQMMSFTFSVVDADGNFKDRNAKASFLVTDDKVLEHIQEIERYIKENRLSGGD